MERKDYDNVIRFAIEREIEAENFYKAIAGKVRAPELKAMFSNFAREELKHQAMLKGILKKENIRTHFRGELDYKISETVETPTISEAMTLADAFALAMKNEEKAMVMYQAMAKDAASEEMKTLFNDLAAMETEHKHLMEKSFTDVAYPESW
ncbi:MAG: ferritin family protein [Pseudomonadota bacterium]